MTLAPIQRTKIESLRERAAEPEVWFSPDEVLSVIAVVDHLAAKLEQSTQIIASLAEELRNLTALTIQPGEKGHE